MGAISHCILRENKIADAISHRKKCGNKMVDAISHRILRVNICPKGLKRVRF